MTSSKGISLLKSFCRKKLNLINGLHREDLELVRSRMPVLWKHINEICLYEETDYLPETTSKLILRLLEIRKLTYENSAIRFQELDYDRKGVFMKHPLEFFPKNPLKKYPKNYSEGRR